jgi:hypothetical protein
MNRISINSDGAEQTMICVSLLLVWRAAGRDATRTHALHVACRKAVARS